MTVFLTAFALFAAGYCLLTVARIVFMFWLKNKLNNPDYPIIALNIPVQHFRTARYYGAGQLSLDSGVVLAMAFIAYQAWPF